MLLYFKNFNFELHLKYMFSLTEIVIKTRPFPLGLKEGVPNLIVCPSGKIHVPLFLLSTKLNK